MPYISRYKQELLDELIDKLFTKLCNESSKEIDYGAVEYCIFRLLQKLAELNMRFTNLNSLVGVLETTKAEVIRRLLGPYEDLKLIQNWKEDASKLSTTGDTSTTSSSPNTEE